jgi:signal transduction histidine kinase
VLAREAYDGDDRVDTAPVAAIKLKIARAERWARRVLHEFLESKRAEIIARTKAKVAARPAPRATEAELTHGVPLFLEQLIDTLKRSALPGDDMTASATKHGNEMLRLGFTVGQVVHDYGDVCQAVTELAFELNAQITVDEFHTLNRCLDDAIADAVTEYARLREQSRADEETERMGALAHELRNFLNTAMLSFGILKRGAVSVGGSTGALLERSLKNLNDLIGRSLAEVRLQSTVQRRETILLAQFVEEVEIGATLEAKARGQHLTVEPAEYGIAIDADRQLLAAAVANLLQNAFKFTHAAGHVWLRTRATADQVFIDIEDECGGLSPGKAEMLFRPFQQGSMDRSGLGLGLSISRKAVQLHGGEVLVRNLPGKGCVFTVQLPRTRRANA